MGCVPRFPINLRVSTPSADQQPNSGLVADYFAKQMLSDLCKLRQRLEEAQRRMILEADKSRHPHNFNVGDSVFLSPPGSVWLAMKILANWSRQISIPESFNGLLLGCFALPKPSEPMLFG